VRNHKLRWSALLTALATLSEHDLVHRAAFFDSPSLLEVVIEQHNHVARVALFVAFQNPGSGLLAKHSIGEYVSVRNAGFDLEKRNGTSWKTRLPIRNLILT
jgi:hypothetical protein